MSDPTPKDGMFNVDKRMEDYIFLRSKDSFGDVLSELRRKESNALHLALAFNDISQEHRTQAARQLEARGQRLVLKHITQLQVERARYDPQGLFPMVATSQFLEHLPANMRSCMLCNERYADWEDMIPKACGKHSFHGACAMACLELRKEPTWGPCGCNSSNKHTLRDWRQELGVAVQRRESVGERPDEVQIKLQETAAALDDMRKCCNRLVSQLSRLQSQGKIRHQLCDDELESLVRQLRYDILCFSAASFTEGADEPSLACGEFWRYVFYARPAAEAAQASLMSTSGISPFIQSFIWGLLVDEVFEQFLWAPEPCNSIAPVYHSLKRRLDRDAQTQPEAEQKFQMWKANTSAFILDLVEDPGDKDLCKSAEKQVSAIAKRSLELLGPIIQDSHEDALEGLEEIVEKALILDLKICRQGARIDWLFPSPIAPVLFDPESMAFAAGASPGDEKNVAVVVAPALKKRGKSTGEIDDARLLLKMDVVCAPSMEEGPTSRW